MKPIYVRFYVLLIAIPVACARIRRGSEVDCADEIK